MGPWLCQYQFSQQSPTVSHARGPKGLHVGKCQICLLILYTQYLAQSQTHNRPSIILLDGKSSIRQGSNPQGSSSLFLFYITDFYVVFPLNKSFFKDRIEIQWPSSCSFLYRRGNWGTERERALPKGRELSSTVSEFPQTWAFYSTLLDHLPGRRDRRAKRGAGMGTVELQLPGAWCQKCREGEASPIAPTAGNRPQTQSEGSPKIYAPRCLSLCYL